MFVYNLQNTAPLQTRESGERLPCVSHKSLSPKQLGESRHGVIKANTQTERAATLQLQANMLLLISALLHSKVKSGEFESINIMTSYGMLMGHGYPLKVLKLSVHFEEGTLYFEEHFSIAPCLMHSVYISTRSWSM